MIPKNSQFSKIDPDTERRRILAKVYSLLIRFADESENPPMLLNLVSEEAMVQVPTLPETDAATKKVNS